MAPTIAPAPVKTLRRRAATLVPRVTAEQRALYEAILAAAAARQGLSLR